MLCFIVYII